MFSRSSFLELKHKAKKKVMTSIGRTEEQQEDPIFTAVLFSVEHLINELKDIQFKANGLADTGRHYNQSLVHLCGSGINGNELFNEQTTFIKALRESLCSTLDRFLELDVPKMNLLVLGYKTSKLNYDTEYVKTLKTMGLNGASLVDQDQVVRNNPELSRLKQICEDSMREIINLRKVFKGHLDNEVTRALEQVKLASTAGRHHLWLKYFKSRIVITSAMCQAGTLSGRTVAEPIKHSLLPQIRLSSQRNPESKGKDNNFAIHGEDPDNQGKLLCKLMLLGTEDMPASNSVLRACDEDSECYPRRRTETSSRASRPIPDTRENEQTSELKIGSEIDSLYIDVPNPPSRKAPSIPRSCQTRAGEAPSGTSEATFRTPSTSTLVS